MLGDNLKKLRDSKNMTQDDLCNVLNIKQATLSQYENNKRVPDLDMLIKIANYFNTSVDYLIGRYKENK